VIRRRDLLKLGAAALAGLAARRASPPAASGPFEPALPTRPLGRTGHAVRIFSLGGQAALEHPNNQDVAVPIIERALDLGVNYLDTSARYGGPARWSEHYLGLVMKRRRSEAFLATKTHDRTRDGSLRLLDQSFELLQTDHLDLWQLHNLQTMDDVDRIFAKGGAIEALLQAREQKLVRFLGVTGHADPDVLITAIQRFPFDTVLMALNAADRHHLSFADRLLPLAVERRMGVVGMKIPARGRILSSWTPVPDDKYGAKTPGTLSMPEALRYVLTLPVSTVIVGCDSIRQLEENIAIARGFTPLGVTEMAALEERARPVHRQALFFRRWEA
jgi:predicted aldo/keto reductase-like oxidoreductase